MDKEVLDFFQNKDNLERLNHLLEHEKVFDFQKKVAKYVNDLSKYHNLLCKNNEILRIKNEQFEKNDYSLDKIASIVLDFYKDFDADMYDYIKKTIDGELRVSGVQFKNVKERKKYIEKNKLYEQNDTIVFVNEPTDMGGENAVGTSEFDGKKVKVISLSPRNTAEGLLVVAHEFAHMLSQRVVENKCPKEDSIGEIESLFIEKVFRDWLFEKGYISKDELEKLGDRRNSLVGEIASLLQEKDFCNTFSLPLSKKTVVETMKNIKPDSLFARNQNVIANRMKSSVETGRTSSYFYRYVVGELYSQELYSQYIKDAVSAKDTFKNLLNSAADLSFEDVEKMITGKDFGDLIRKNIKREEKLLNENLAERILNKNEKQR